MRKYFFLFIISVSLAVPGCYYDKEDELYPNQLTCDVSNITYTGTVNTVFQNNGCFSCHSGTNPEGNINLQTHASVKTLVNSGKLIGAITHSSGFSPMPKGGNKLSTCDIDKIKAWIDAGALNN